MRARTIAPAHIAQGSSVHTTVTPVRRQRPSVRAASWMASSSAWAVGSFALSRATAPTGTSPRAPASPARASASRMASSGVTARVYHAARSPAGGELGVIRAVEAAGAARLDLALGRDLRGGAAAVLPREELLREAVVEEVPGELLVEPNFAVHEEVGIVRPAPERRAQIAARLDMGELEEVRAAAVAAREERLKRRLARREEVHVDPLRA